MLTMASCTGSEVGPDVLAWLQPAIFLQVSIRQCLHVGQDEWELSHLSMHLTWNPWLHLGRSRTCSPGVNSERQITHCVSRPGRFKSVEYFTIGKVFNAFRFTPVFAAWVEGFAADSEATKLEHLNAHLMMEFSPSEQISAHNRTDRTITTFASKLLSVLV
jgi:hypothetical protein